MRLAGHPTPPLPREGGGDFSARRDPDSERDFVVEVAAPAATATAGCFRGRGGVVAAPATATVGARVEHGELAAEALQDDLRGIFVVTLLVLPLACL